MAQSIAKKFNIGELLLFAFPSILMMMFMSLYTIVDGLFVSRFIGTDALSAVNITYPAGSVILAVGVMFATGGSAIIATQLGEGKERQAQQNLTLITLTAVAISIVISVSALIGLDPLVRLLGASEELVEPSKAYLRILMFFAPMSVLQLLFQNFFVMAGRPGLGLGLTIGAGIFNMVFDYVFIVPMGMGIEGAAYATVLGYCIPALVGMMFFLLNRKGLHFSKPKFSWRTIGTSCFNGSSEMVTNLSGSVTTLLFNIIMMRLLGSNGVAAITIVLYSQFLMTSLFLGFSIGVAPIISYHAGAGDEKYLKRLYRICMGFILAASVAICLFAYFSSGTIVQLFTPKSSPVYDLAVHGFRLFTIAFLFAGTNIFVSALYTALSDGKTSALISFARTFLFTVIGIIGLSALFGLDGLWLAVPFAEFSTTVCVLLIARFQRTKRDKEENISGSRRQNEMR